MNKRGASLVISWVLIIGFSIALATGIFLWAKEKTESLTESTLSDVETGIICQEVTINVKANVDCDLTIHNKGKLSLHKFIINTLKPEITNTVVDQELSPMTSFEYTSVVQDTTKLEVIPVIKYKDNFFECSERRVEVEC